MKTMKTFAVRFVAMLGCLLALMAGGCVKNEFKVDFEFPKDHIGNYLLSYYAWDTRAGRWIEHTASIQEGVASVGGITRLPTLIYVSDASNPDNSMVVYVERGDEIRISGEAKDMGAWKVSGNKLSERWSAWRNEAYGKKSDIKAFHKSIAEFVEKNPKDELSAILLLTEWNRREDPEGFVRLWNSVDKGSRGQRLVEMCGVADLLGVEFVATAEGGLEYAKDVKIKSLPLRSRDNGTDTVRFDKASILYFYVENNAARREALDSLKVLAKAYPDSSRRVIADIYMDSDSTTWTAAIRRDSLKGAVRAWQPRGLAEENMVRMGVARIPWFVVKDKSAKETYAGADLKEAMAAFRKAAGKPGAKAQPATKTDAKPTADRKPEQDAPRKQSHQPAPKSNNRPMKPHKNTK